MGDDVETENPFRVPVVIATGVLLFGILIAQTPSPPGHLLDIQIVAIAALVALAGIIFGLVKKLKGAPILVWYPGYAILVGFEFIFAASMVVGLALSP